MKNIIIALSALTAFPTLASLDSMSEKIDCNNLPASIATDQTSFSCSIQQEHSDTASKSVSKILSPNGLPTNIIFHNKGGYVAWMMVEWYTPNGDGTFSRHYHRSPTISAATFTSLMLPANAERVRVHSQLNTSAFWQPVRDIFIKDLTSSDNVWMRTRKGEDIKNIIQFDTWGTTFNSPWSLVQPQHTDRNDNRLKNWAEPGYPGDFYFYDNPYNNETEIFKLTGRSDAYFPIDKTSNSDWEYKHIHEWNNTSKGYAKSVYLYDNPYNHKKEVFLLREFQYRLPYFPTTGYSDDNWLLLGTLD